MIKLLLLCLSLSSCCSYSAPKTKSKVWARITFYHPGEDKWGYKVSASSKMRNKEGVGVAAHPDFKFFTKIEIPALKGVLDKDAEFTVIDRGRDVTSKKASKGKYYVFDVFVNKRGKSFRNFCAKMPKYAWVYLK